MRGAEESLHDAEGRIRDIPSTDEGPAEMFARSEREQRVRKALATLSSRTAEIVRRRFGIGGSPFATRGQLSEELGVTPERVRQIEQAASCRLHEILTEFEGL
ncbi:MAG: hypothetical protein IID44_17910 [Planctomycetes bacterium]|nr:hypothetical protein [Planctomycetota bacterium]